MPTRSIIAVRSSGIEESPRYRGSLPRAYSTKNILLSLSIIGRSSFIYSYSGSIAVVLANRISSLLSIVSSVVFS